jgi:hypothetical protein
MDIRVCVCVVVLGGVLCGLGVVGFFARFNVRVVVVLVCLVLILLAEWVMWECVVNPLIGLCMCDASREIPAPFYLFYAPIWFWHDLSITIVIVCSTALAYLALTTTKPNREHNK